MSEIVALTTIGFLTPFISFVFMYVWLVYHNRKTTAEIKWNLPPEVLLKIMVVILVVIVTFILTYSKVLDVSAASAILGSVVTGTITSFKKSDNTPNQGQ